MGRLHQLQKVGEKRKTGKRRKRRVCTKAYLNFEKDIYNSEKGILLLSFILLTK